MGILRFGLVISAMAISLIVHLDFAEARATKHRTKFLKHSTALDYSIAQIPQRRHRGSLSAKAASYRHYRLLRQIDDIDFEHRPERSPNLAEAIIEHPGPQTAQLLTQLDIPAFEGVPPIAFLGQRKSSPDGY
jgi:hypothetical protein